MKKYLYVALLAFGVVVMMTPPAIAQEEKPFTIHGEVRFRGEYDNNTQDLFDDTDDGGLFWPYRVRIAAEGKFTKNVTGWLEFQNAGVAGGDVFAVNPTRTGFDEFGVQGNGVELYQGNITLDQLWSKRFSLRLGRQEIVAGNELLLGDLDFYAGLSHDGVVGNWKFNKVNVMVWYTRPTEGTTFNITGGGFLPPDQIGFNSCAGGCQTEHFLGGYGSWNFKKDHVFDVYLMSLANRNTGGNFQTLGVRYGHDVMAKNGLFWNIEFAKQFGQVASAYISGADIDASGDVLEGWFGYNWRSGTKTHRFYGRLEMASGDDPLTADETEGFQPLFGDFHNRTGRGDWFQLADATTGLAGGVSGGLQAWSVGYTGYYNDRHEFGVAFWNYSLDQEIVGFGDKLGTAFDIWYGFNYTRNLSFTASVSQLSPDDALSLGGDDDSVSRIYGQARLRF